MLCGSGFCGPAPSPHLPSSLVDDTPCRHAGVGAVQEAGTRLKVGFQSCTLELQALSSWLRALWGSELGEL